MSLQSQDRALAVVASGAQGDRDGAAVGDRQSQFEIEFVPAGDRFTPAALHRLDLGGRYFYAPQSMRDESGRRLMFGWLQEGRPDSAAVAAGWSGVMSLPRVLTLAADGSIRQAPAPEVDELRDEQLASLSTVLSAKPAEVARGDELDLENPFVMTCLYPKSEEDVNYTSDNNDLKVIATRSGNMIVFVDEDGDAKIQISNRNKTDTFLEFAFKDDGKIRLHVENGLFEVKAKEITIEATEDITVSAGGKFDLHAGEISMKADQNIKIESGTDTKIKAGTELDTEGTASAKMKGAQLTLEGDAVAELKSSGTTVVQGSLITLN